MRTAKCMECGKKIDFTNYKYIWPLPSKYWEDGGYSIEYQKTGGYACADCAPAIIELQLEEGVLHGSTN